MEDKRVRLTKLRQRLLDSNVCPDLAKQAKHLVFGEGDPNANIIFIGEAPGRNEDETGRPFVGAAGKFLDELLQHIGLKREDVYITSILKYRPPNNRDPRPDEKTAFWPYLEEQLNIIQPTVIVTLGRHSLNCFLPQARISEVHGQAMRYKAFTLVPLYHPAAVLYNGQLKQTLIKDIEQLTHF